MAATHVAGLGAPRWGRSATLTQLLGRHRERRRIEDLLDGVRAGHGAVVVVRGQAGIGKTALLEHLRSTAAARGVRVEEATGVEAETQFAFAGLHQLCAPLLGSLPALPEPQRMALDVALGTTAGPVPDRFLVGLATLTLLAEAAERRPLLCLVDDAQWLDPSSVGVLTFAARRVGAERLMIVFAAREGDDGPNVFAGLPELRLGGLDASYSRELLDSAVASPLDVEVRERIVSEARGNPLALLELAASSRPGRLAGGFRVADVEDVPGRLEREFQRRSAGLPDDTRLLLVIAAADPTGDASLLARAAAEAGIDPDSAASAEASGLIDIGPRVRFRHPLVRSAVYRSARPAERRRAHRALASSTDPVADPDRRVWHRAQAVLGVDEEVAAELEHSAGRARARGGYAAAGAFLHRSAQLTPDHVERARRSLVAARDTHEAGDPTSALDLLATAAAGPLDPLRRARADLLRAQIEFHMTRRPEVPEMLRCAAAILAPLDPALSRDAYLHALDAALINGGPAAARIAREVLDTPMVRTRPSDGLLHGLAVTMVHGFAAGVPELRRALDALRETASARPAPDPSIRPWLWLAGRVAVGILDDDLAVTLAEQNVASARAAGALAMLPAALNFHANVLVITGQLARAGELVAEARALAESTGGVPLHHAENIRAAWMGDRTTVEELCGRTFGDPSYPDEGAEATMARYARAVLDNAQGRYSSAKDAAARMCGSPELSLSSVGLSELVEASVRSGDPDGARDALERLQERVDACATSWALGLEARSRALTTSGPSAEDHYREAVARLSESRMEGEAARAHLLHGEWLRREGRRREARTELHTAHDLLTDMGAEAFAARAARELGATGAHPRTRTTRTTDELTAQELHVARLVSTGATSREVGAQLFLSPRTIEAHLRSIFRKLGLTSRRQLRLLDLP